MDDAKFFYRYFHFVNINTSTLDITWPWSHDSGLFVKYHVRFVGYPNNVNIYNLA